MHPEFSRSLHRALAAVMLFLPWAMSAAPRQVIVYSFVTDAGRRLALPTIERPQRCALGSGGYHEWGGIRAGEKPIKLQEIEPLVRAALRVQAYEGLRSGERPDLVIEFYWGCLRPDARGLPGRGRSAAMDFEARLDLVGGRALASSRNRILRDVLLEAAAEERYFLILSAFEPDSHARRQKVLLWRTQISLPIGTLNQSQAFPVLAACGATHFGRPTTEPCFINLDVEKAVQAGLPRQAR